MENHVEALGSHVESIDKTLAALELGRQEGNDRISWLEAHHEELHQKLDSLIDLLSTPHTKGSDDEGLSGEHSLVEERESENDNCGFWYMFSGRWPRDGGDKFPISLMKIHMPTHSSIFRLTTQRNRWNYNWP